MSSACSDMLEQVALQAFHVGGYAVETGGDLAVQGGLLLLEQAHELLNVFALLSCQLPLFIVQTMLLGEGRDRDVRELVEKT